MNAKALTLNENDPQVIAARDAEKRLLDFYGLTAKTHFIPLPGLGIGIRVTEIGDGRPILIVPGNTGDSFPLIPLMEQLKGRRLIVLNRPGGGLSEGMDHRTVDLRKFAVETLTTVLDFFSLAKVPIVAHSIGGHWSLWAAMDRPERVTALVLLGVPGNIISTRPPFALRLLSVPVLNKVLFSLIKPKNIGQALRGLSFMGHPPETLTALPESMADCYFYFQRLPHYELSSLSLMEAKTPKITAIQLKGVSQPVMFFWGTNDPFGSVETGRMIANELPRSEFHAIAGAGHLPWLDEPEECGRLTLNFLTGY